MKILQKFQQLSANYEFKHHINLNLVTISAIFINK
jgi:hypothetical protein